MAKFILINRFGADKFRRIELQALTQFRSRLGRQDTCGTIESGNRRAKVDIVWDIARALQCEFCELFPAVWGPADEPDIVPVFLLDHRTLFRFRELVKLSQAAAAGLFAVKNQRTAFAASFQINDVPKNALAEAFLKSEQVPCWKVLAERRSDRSVSALRESSSELEAEIES